jgi:hypothetical protein
MRDRIETEVYEEKQRPEDIVADHERKLLEEKRVARRHLKARWFK